MRFERDPAKAAGKVAATVFRDPLSATVPDPDHSLDEASRLLVVAHADRDDTIRIISARPATPGERKIYEEG